ncbi:MAG TPA: alpha/beta hydrolase [Abditibacteriaceae bacterium]|jgi:pimeloyl-ACP methyl ester carboxylesterase
MTSWHEGDIKVDGLRLHYTRTGGAKPPVVLAHGFSDDGSCWKPVAQILSSQYDLIMVDARGHGRSAAPESGYSLMDHARDIAGVINGLGLHRPAVLGHSMGGATALVLAGAYPLLPSAILIEDAGAFGMKPSTPTPASQEQGAEEQQEQERRQMEEEQASRERQSGMHAWIRGIQGKTREELIAQQRAQTPHWSDDELEPWADSKLRLSLHVLNRSDAAPVDWPILLRQITCPALLITGDPSMGAIVTEQGATELQTFMPQLRIAHIPNAGHSIRRDQFSAYMDVVRAFLAEWDSLVP